MKWLWKWFADRWPYYQLRDLLLKEDIPGGASFAYTLGTSLIMVFTLQAVTGVLQLMYYVPTIDHAYDSVNYLRTEVPFGWLIHNMHYWGAQAMVFLVALHMMRVYVWGAYKKTPLTWFIGVGLVLTVMALSFTGAPLIWDQAGYWAGEVGSSIAGMVPVVGDLQKIILRGSQVMGQLALSRFFTFHIGVFVPLLVLLAGAHLASFRTSGVGGSWDPEKQKKTGPLWPDQIFKDMVTVSAVFFCLITLSVFSPVPFTGSADTLNISYVPKPEWNFLFLYQALKYFPGALEPIGAGGVPTVFVMLLLIVPFVDRNPERNPFKRPVAMACLLVYACGVLALTIIGYLSPGFGEIPEIKETKSKEQTMTATQGGVGVKRGEELFRLSGCLNCHKIRGKGGSVGPELAGDTLKGKSRQWLIEQIMNSKAHFPQGGRTASMTAFTNLSKDELNDIADYLLSLTSGPGGAGEVRPEAGQKSSPNEVKEGQQVFQSSGCSGCHKVNGRGGSVGPELSEAVLKGKSREWLTEQITAPKSHNPKSIMPAFANLDKEKLNNLVTYLISLTGTKGTEQESAVSQVQKAGSSPAPRPGLLSEKKALELSAGKAAFIIGGAENGADLYKEQCASCHGSEGKGGIKNPGADEGIVPPLNPIDRALYDANPRVFASNIDKIIQHGAMPSGPNPVLHMPAWGDTRSLTQEEISNIEAFILKLNGADRGKILNPGLQPRTFFYIVSGLYILFILIQGGIRIRKNIP